MRVLNCVISPLLRINVRMTWIYSETLDFQPTFARHDEQSGSGHRDLFAPMQRLVMDSDE